MRLLLLIAVIALFVDAFFYSGRFTKSAYTHVSSAAGELVALIGEAVEVSPDKKGSTQL